jgi:aspartyl-tRNA(Asn)/glutamyl-tRNA(Gln) amidotransferase subunit A
MSETELAYASISELAPRLASGELSPIELTNAMLARIARYNPVLNAYITVTEESAREAAHAAAAAIRAGNYLGPLHGIPIAIKDLFATRAVRTTFGSRVFADWVPDHDAAAVERLRDAGAILIGKTNMHELAYGTTSANAHYGPVRNPWNTACHPGGSSGGSAVAVAAGLACAALGSDTGASVRQPAACCGIVGLKPTFGRVSKFGALPLAWSMDHVGPMARTVQDCALLLQTLAGYDRRDPGCVRRVVPDFLAELANGISGWRVGVARDYFFDDCEPDIVAAVEESLQVLRGLGASVEDIILPDMRAALAAGALIIAVEAVSYHAADLRERPQAFSKELQATLELGGYYSGVQYVQAQRLRRKLSEQLRHAIRGFDALVMPTSPVPATEIGNDPPGHTAMRSRNTLPFNFISLPAISVPCGFTRTGLPIGLQLVGQPFAETRVLGLAHAYEQTNVASTRYPNLEHVTSH